MTGTFRPKLWWRVVTASIALHFCVITVVLGPRLIDWPPSGNALVLILVGVMVPAAALYLAVTAWTVRLTIGRDAIEVQGVARTRSISRDDVAGWLLEEPDKLRRFVIMHRNGTRFGLPIATDAEAALLAWLHDFPNVGQHVP